MFKHTNFTDQEFAERFADGSFPPSCFSHEAHLRLAWIHIRQYGLAQAEQNLCTQIAAFDRQHGDGTKFHTTLTVAAARMVHHFIQKSPVRSFEAFIQAQPRLLTSFKELLSQHYSEAVLWDPVTRDRFVEPDLVGF